MIVGNSSHAYYNNLFYQRQDNVFYNPQSEENK